MVGYEQKREGAEEGDGHKRKGGCNLLIVDVLQQQQGQAHSWESIEENPIHKSVVDPTHAELVLSLATNDGISKNIREHFCRTLYKRTA
jgi:hypothetical protein